MAVSLKKEHAQQVQSELSLEGLVNLDVEIDEIQKLLDLKLKERELVLKSLIKRKVSHEGDWSLIRKDTVRRSVIVEELRKKYPQTFAKVAKFKVSVTDLEKVMDEDKMKDLIMTKVFTTYETVYDPHSQQA